MRAAEKRSRGDVVIALSGYGDPLEEVAGLAAERRELETAISEAIYAARADGATWTALARALGVSPQAVQKRYGSSTIARQQ